MLDAKKLFSELLRQNEYSVTKTRMHIFEALYTYGLQTPTQLIAHTPTVDRASIYRTIELLEKIGVIHRVPQGLKYKIELSDIFLPHHHHIVCSVCGLTKSIELSKLERLLVDIADTENFQLTAHRIELTGTCQTCIKK